MKKDKGFSLIELIIAIAILVILTGLLAPQFMKYIEKSRQASMMQKLDSIYEALQVAYIEAAESGKVSTSGGILINRKEPMGGSGEQNTLDKAVWDELIKSIGEKEMLNIAIMTDKALGGQGGSTDKYSLTDVWIAYFPKENDHSNYYYFRINTTEALENELKEIWPGTYGEYRNGSPIVWK